jgi:lysophospholipase L1-like esterase
MNYKKLGAILLAAAMLLAMCACGKAKPIVYTDVNDSSWYAKYVDLATGVGIATGYDDGTFKPREYISAGEFVKMLAKADGANPEKFEARHWAFLYWDYLDKYDVFSGTKITGLRDCLNGTITRQDAAAIIYSMLVNVLGEDTVPIGNPAADIPGYLSLDSQYLTPVAELYAKGILTGVEGMSFAGSRRLTRGEAAALIIRLFDKDSRTVVKPVRTSAYTSLGTFSGSTLFIGDSLTYQLVENYLIPNKMIGSASYMAAPCTTVKYFLTRYWVLTPSEDNCFGVACNSDYSGLCFSDALAKSEGKFKTIFFMLGSNGSDNVTLTQYTNAIKLILKYNPKAVIYMQTVPNSATGAVKTDRVNGLIKQAVTRFNDDGNNNVKLLDTNSAWTAKSVGVDGVHLTSDGLDAWYRYIYNSTKAK